MQYLADLGFINALGFAWSGSIEQGVEHQKHLARYIIARYGALPVVWTLSGEVAGYFPGKPRETAIKGWREVAKYVEKWTDMEHCRPHIIRMSVRLQITIMTNRGLILC